MLRRIHVRRGRYRLNGKPLWFRGSNLVFEWQWGGPGGLFHSLRQIPIHLEIAEDAGMLCPDALVMVESNPLNRAICPFA